MPNDKPAANNDVKRTIRVNRGRVRVNDGQHLHYSITVDGQTPIFNVSCTHKTHFAADTLGTMKHYDVVWPRSSADETPDQDGESYTFSMSFLTAIKYSIRVELHDAAHTLVGGDDGIVLDADYECENPELSYFEGWTVRTKPKA